MASRTALKLLRLAREGDVAAQFELGSLYLCGGEGISANTEAALMWLARAAERGHVEAIRAIARHIPPHASNDAPRLLDYYEQVAREGDRSAALHAALALRLQDDAASRERSRIYLAQAAEAGCSQAQLLLARMLDEGEPHHAADAERLFTRAAESGSDDALHALAERVWSKRDLNGVATLRRVASKDAPVSCYRLGLMLRERAERDGDSALLQESGQWLQHAAEAGLAEARHECGAMMGGLAAGPWKRNYKRAARWLEQALAQGHAPSGLALFQLREKSRGTALDAPTALEALNRSARLGFAPAQHQLGAVRWAQLKRERGLSIDALIDCARWLAEAAAQDFAPARALLAEVASPPPPHGEDTRRYQRECIARVSDKHPEMGARLLLMADFGLQKQEALLIDPIAADRERFLAVNPAQPGRRARARLVQIVTEEQRASLALAKQVLGGAAGDEVDVADPYTARYRKLVWLAGRFDIEWSRFCPAV